ncbi:MAG: GatB/YqeY domain-containing protein, partial [Pseudonocardiaceae bacterium]
SALRSALAAIDNAEAVDAAPAPPPAVVDSEIAGSVGGLWAAEVQRRSLTDAQVEEIVRAEVAERLAAAHDYERSGHREHAQRLRGEATVLSRYLPG